MKKLKLKRLSSDALQCALCQANFEVWMSNQRITDVREESLRKHFLLHCPSCKKADEKN